ncbi:MAG: creatininase family protein [Dehalococcoidia bacterium]|nr:creatininase family protein [Dehalococcoidia bacterium]
MKIRLDDMTWADVEELLKKTNVLVVPVGSVEQHGLHLPLSVDSRCATYLAEQAAKKVIAEHKLRVIVAPTIHYTDVTTFQSFPGTIGISADTETRLIADIARSFVSQGFQNIIFLNGHASNVVPISAGLRQVNLEYQDAGLFALNWWALGFETIPKIRKSKASLHADELETSLSLVIQPENVQLDKVVKEIPKYALSEKWVSPDFYGANRVFYHSRRKFPKLGSGVGVMGDPTVASRETGEKIAEAVVNDLVQIILEVARSEGFKA